MLLSSGVSVTWAHRAILANDRSAVIKGLLITILLGILFTEFQAFEYLTASFAINDGVYGSTFYLLTGFHGFHVIIGSLFLSVCLIRTIKYHFLRLHHVGLEASI
jgi:heme/copper-type cytochrome/quinol oxidase subunit 3